MTIDQLNHRIDAARVRAGLTVQDLWLRYVAYGGSNDVFYLDGYLQGLLPMNPFDQSVLSHAVNEALQDSYDTYSIPLHHPAMDGEADPSRNAAAIRRLLDDIDT